MKLDMGTKEEEIGVKLKVKRSPISGSGIARVHSSVLKKGDFIEGKPHFVQKADRKRVMRLVADEIMDKGKISLRQKDMNKLKVSEGDEVTLLPAANMGERLIKGFGLFKKKEE